MINKLSVSVFILILFFITSVPVSAHPGHDHSAPIAITTTTREVSDRTSAIRERIASKEAEIKTRVEKKRTELQERLSLFKDKKKAQIAERVSTNLNAINKNRTTAMTTHIARIEELLTKLETRVNEYQGTSDTTAVKASITTTKSLLSKASNSVVAQAGKDYTVSVTNEEQIRSDVEAMRNQLLKDLQAVHNDIKLARESLTKTIRLAYQTLGKETVESQ